MINFIIFYLSTGFLFSFGLNLTLYAFHKPILTFSETIAAIFFWPTVIGTFINEMNKAERD
jgi:hypothetical protein|tara:strand:- start:905 stop:1087 length:183 start_codon:yes stop_codon:yes gene_type:complete